MFFRYKPPSYELVRKENPEIQEGGRWRPKECTARQKVAIIIPYRRRETHLKYWLHYLHPILQRQQQPSPHSHAPQPCSSPGLGGVAVGSVAKTMCVMPC